MPAKTDLLVERHPFDYAWRKRFPGARLVAGFEGGAVYAAEGEDAFWLVKDEGTMADFLHPVEDADLLASMVTLQRYSSHNAREAAAQALRDRSQTADDPSR